MTAREAVDYIARNAAQRPWLAVAANRDPLVQRVVAAVDRGRAHFLERHGPYTDDARLRRRVTGLEDRAPCPDIATAFRDADAFAVALARAAEQPDVLAALRTPFDPDSRPERVSVPIESLLGPDGHRYCAGYRLEPVDGRQEAAMERRSAWLAARRVGQPAGDEPRCLPIETFEGGTVEILFQPNGANDGYEIATVFVDPPPA